MRLFGLLVFISLFVPGSVTAAVLINEVAWMGTTESHLCNWIEFYNSGESAVDVADWSLFINDTERVFADGEGSTTVIPAGGYWVLERTTDSCPNPVPDRNDWSLVLGNLPNSGATLALRRGDGSLEDQVAGGPDWVNIGGDNETKDTAQRTESGWITAAPTPGAANAMVEVEPTDVATTTQLAGRVRSARASAPRSLTVPESELKLSIEAVAYSYVNQPLPLTASSSGVVDVVKDSLQYQWNFGDIETSTAGPDVTHTYQHPGTYVVTLHAGYGRHEQVARHTVTVLPIPLEITYEDGVVRLYNTAAYEVDVSNFSIVGPYTMTLPERSWLLPRSALVIAGSELGLNAPRLLTVQDPAGEVVASNYAGLAGPAPALADNNNDEEESTSSARNDLTAVVLPVAAAPSVATGDHFTFQSDAASPEPVVASESTTTVPERASDVSVIDSPAVATATAADEPPDPGQPWLPYAILGLVVIIAGVVLLWPRSSSDLER